RESDDIAWQYRIEDLSSSLVQQRETETESTFDNIQGLVLVTLDDDVLALFHSDFAIENTAQSFQVFLIDKPMGPKLNNERMILDRPIFGEIDAGSPLDAHSVVPRRIASNFLNSQRHDSR